jgi:hypothetical protein
MATTTPTPVMCTGTSRFMSRCVITFPESRTDDSTLVFGQTR